MAKKHEDGWDIQSVSKMMAEQSAKRDSEIQEMNRKLGDPDHFIPNAGWFDNGIGFWRGNGGVIRYDRAKDGLYRPEHRMTCDEETILVLHRLLEKQPRVETTS